MLTQKLDLRSGDTPWDDKVWTFPIADPLPGNRRDVAIIGSGITGAIIAERLSAEGHSVALLDRRRPGMGSTAASTAQIMWAMDVPLAELTRHIGEGEAARRWRRVHAAVRDFAECLDAQGIAADKSSCPTVYLEGSMLNAEALDKEAELHRLHGLPSEFLSADEVERRFGLSPRAAIVSGDGFTIDPVAATHGLLEAARSRGASVCYPVDVTAISKICDGVCLSLGDGRNLVAGDVILATGYEKAPLLLPPAFSLMSTFVMATPAATAPLWRERAMIWEAADPYLYFRTDADGRVIVGGEDEETCNPDRRDELVAEKSGIIAAKAGKVLGLGPLAIDKAWSATFGSSPDGLPAIGRTAHMPHVWLAAGFGGNGIAFSALASDILATALAGRDDPDAACFDPYRFPEA